MKLRVLSIFLTFAMILLMLPNVSIASALADDMPWQGSGTESKPYLISSREEFEAIADAVNSGNDLNGVYFKQTNDIDFGDEVWPTIGITINNATHQFRGVFDGGDNKIYNLYVERHDDDAGLFGYVGQEGMIKNVHIEDSDVSGTYWVGGIAGRNYGIVEYCSFSGYVYGTQQFVGGIVGDNHGGTVRYCYNLGDVEFNQIGGGVVGRNSGGTVENCYNRGNVYADNIVRGYAGGVVGENTAESTVDNCYSDGWVDGNLACGAIVGANGEGSSVENCYYPEEFEDDGLSGVGGSTGTLENVTPKSKEQFDSGEVAWELSQGTNGEGWGQTLNDDDGNHDEHPHFTDVPDKEYPTTPIYRVSFRANDASLLPPDGFMAFYVDPGEDVPPPRELPQDAAWYVKDSNGADAEYDGTNIQCDINAFAGKRILFAGEDGTVEHRITYSTEEQTVDLDLYMKYAEGGPYSEGRFEYEITADTDSLGAELNDDQKTITIPAGTGVTDDGYTLTIKAHEKEPFIMPLALGSFGTDDIYLTVHIMIEKATPEIIEKPTADEIDYGIALSGSTISGGEAVHPATRKVVDGAFKWNDVDIIPNVNEAAITGYYVTFEPVDTDNYNTVIIMVTLTVNKVASTIVTPPTGKDSIYNGVAEDLINRGSAEGGTMKYWLSDDPNAEPPEDNSEYSFTVPSRANAGTYTVWYKVIGDENHNDTEPKCVQATISQYRLVISEHVTYNGGNTFTLVLEGVKVDGENSPRTVIAYVETSGKNAGSYGYPSADSDGTFTVELSNSNYVVDKDVANTMVIDQLPAVLKWTGKLAFYHDDQPHTVEAEMVNGIDGDKFTLTYKNNSFIDAGSYEAEVIGLGNPNYTLDTDKGAQNVTQLWRIFHNDENITLDIQPTSTAEKTIVYGDKLTLTAIITALSAGTPDVAEFFVNGESVGLAPVLRSGSQYMATLTIENANNADHFSSLGANIVRVEYLANNKVSGMDADTVFVSPKPLTAKFSNTEKVYDGNEVAVGLVIEINPEDIEGTDEIRITADNYTYNGSNAADGKIITAHNVTLSGAQSGNYTIDSELETQGKITPKTVKLEWRGVTGLVYNGSSANVNATATETLPGDKCEIIVQNGDQTSAGRYTATAVDVDNHNYQLPQDDTVYQDYKIEKADLYIEDQECLYNGTKIFSVKVDGADGKKVAVELTASSPNAGDYTYSADAAEASAYTASTKDTNYNIASGGILTILKADPNCKAPVPLKLPYTGLLQELVISGTADGGEMQYSLTKDGTYYTAVPTGIELGTYTVWYKVLGDNNHNDIEPRSVEAEIIPEDDTEYEPGRPGTPNGSTAFPNDPTSSDSDPSNDPNISDSDSSDKPNDSAASDSDATNKPDNSQDHNGVPNTGVEINYAFFFVLMCLCGLVISSIVRKVR